LQPGCRPSYQQKIKNTSIPGNDSHLKTDEIKDQVHAKVFKKAGGSVDHVPTGAINVEMGF
jgi:hypothetical protein